MNNEIEKCLRDNELKAEEIIPEVKIFDLVNKTIYVFYFFVILWGVEIIEIVIYLVYYLNRTVGREWNEIRRVCFK